MQGPKLFPVIIILVIFVISIFSGRIITGSSHQLALALILGSIFIVIILVNTDAALAILILSMLLSPEISAGQVPGRDIVIRVDDLLLAVITFTWFAKTAYNKGLTLFMKTPLNKAIGFYIFVCIISTLRGAVLGHVVPLKGLFYILRYAEYFLLYLLVANHVHSRKQIKFFLTFLFSTCAIVSIFGILQIPSGKRVSAPFEGEVGEPNTLGGYLLLIFCIAAGVLLQNVPRKMKIALLGLCVLIFVPFLYTLSRASYIAIILSFFTFIVLSKKKKELITAATALILLVVLLKPEAVFSRVKYTFHKEQENLASIGGTYLDPSASARIFGWKDSIKAWRERPVLGHGVSGFVFIDGQYIRTLPELGIIGFFALLWFLWTILKHSLSIYKKMDDELYKGLALGFLSAFVGLMIHALASNTFIITRIMEPFWFMAGIIMILPTLTEEESEEEK